MTSASTFSEKSEKPAPDPQAAKPNPVPEEMLSLPKRPSALAEAVCLLHGQPPAAGQVVVVHRQPALQQILAHSQSDLYSELGGVLLGHVYREGQTLIVEVEAAIPAVSEDHGPVHFTFTADAWSQIHKDRAATYPVLEIVGWFHTHPGLGVFYSSDDAVVHSAAFTLPWHVGLVVDPVRQEAAYFGWADGELAPILGFYEKQDVQGQSVVNWRAVRTAVYNLPEAELYEARSEGGAAQGLERAVYMSDSAWATLSPSSRKLGLIIGSLALAFTLFLFAFWVVPQNRRLNQLETVLLTISNSNVNPNAHACPDPRLRILSPAMGSGVRLGSQLEIIGTAVFPEAARYQVEMRPQGAQEWQLVGSQRRPTDLNTLAAWNTADAAAGSYELRLTAIDSSNIRLANSPNCMLMVQLVP